MKNKTICILFLIISILFCFLTACEQPSSSIGVSYNYSSSTASTSDGDLPEYAQQEVSLPYVDPNLTAPLGVADFDYYYRQLDGDTERAVYKSVVSALKEFAVKTRPVPIDDSFTEERAGALFEEVLLDYPQFFACVYGYKTVYEDGALYFTLNYRSGSLETLRAAQDAFYTAANVILTEASEIEDKNLRQLFLYETVMNTAEYDFAELALVGTNLNAHTANGCLVEHKTVCDGYSKAFVLLANYSGIESAVMRGYLNDTVYHAWIAVRSENGWLFSDPTLDDAEQRYAGKERIPYAYPDGKESMTPLPDAVLHTYYNLTYAEIARNHVFDAAGEMEQQADAATPAAYRWQARQQVLFEDSTALDDWLGKTIPAAKSGDVIEFGVGFGVTRGKMIDMIAAYIDGFALTANGANTNFALYVY